MVLKWRHSAFVALLTILVAAAGQNAVQENDDAMAQPVSEEPVKFIHKLNPGEREYLSPNLIGVQNIAVTFLPLSMNFINIIDAYREIVNGVQYDILLNAVNTKDNDTEVVCQLLILEKPWLTTQWGDKVRELVQSNCTTDDDEPSDLPSRSSAINNKLTTNTLFNGGARNEVNADEMADIESQIISASNVRNTNKKRSTTTTTTTVKIDTAQVTEDQRQDTDFDAINGAAVITTDDKDKDSKEQDTTQVPELSELEKKWLDDIFTVGAINFENSIGIHRESSQPVDNEDADEHTDNYLQSDQYEHQFENDEAHQRLKRNLNGLVGGQESIDSDEAMSLLQNSFNNYKSQRHEEYRIIRITSASKQMVAGNLVVINAVVEKPNGEQGICKIDIWSRVWLQNGTETTINCEGENAKKIRHSRSVEYAEKKTHKKHAHYSLNKIEHLFNKFQVKFNRFYHTTAERQMRLRIFKQNLRTIEELNRNELGSAKYGITEFSDMTTSEYKARTGLWQRDVSAPTNPLAEIPDIELPKEFDWREKNAVSKVKNQGMCGSCWAFSVIGNVEGLHAVRKGKLEEYSEQELLDCDTIDSACNGGLPDNAYKALLQIGGLEYESEYPYEGRKGQCHFNTSKAHVRVRGGVDLPKNETAMAQWLIANGPISIGINANAMQFYRGGVSHPWHPLCSRKNLDHGVLIVGYGVSEYPSFKKVLPYWIIKNSWGSKWGEQGYYRVYRGDNTCGLSEMATSALLADD